MKSFDTYLHLHSRAHGEQRPKRRNLLKRILAVAAVLASFAFPSHSAYVGATRLEETVGGQNQIAVFSLASIAKAAQAISDGLSGIGMSDSSGIASAIISWLVMLPSIECADLSRRATVILVTPPEGQDLPDQVAIIPLSPVNGELRLRQSLADSYESVSGKSVLFCSRPRNDSVAPTISLLVTRETAFIASSRESLRWIALHWKSGNIPEIPDLRPSASISAFFDAPLFANVLDTLLAGADEADDTRSAIRYIMLFRDLLRRLDAMHVSISGDINSWNIAAKLTPPAGGNLEPMLVSTSQTAAANAPLSAIPRNAYSVAAGHLASISGLFPPSFLERFGGTSTYSFFFGRHPLPGLNLPSALNSLESLLSGESASAFCISPGSPPVRLQVFSLKNPDQAAESLRTLLPWNSSAPAATFRFPRTEGNRIIYGYDASRKASAESSDDYAASALILLARLNSVELAIDNGNLVVVSGPTGAIDDFLPLPDYLRKKRTIAELPVALAATPPEESLVCAGELRPTQTFAAIVNSIPGLTEISRQLPRHGGGLSWRISSTASGDHIFEVSISSSELLAISVLQRIDQRQIGGILLDHILKGQDMSK